MRNPTVVRLARLALALVLFAAGCSEEPLVPRGDASWSWRLGGASPDFHAPTVAPILKERLRKAGIKEPKVHAAPPPTRGAKTPGSFVASEVRVEVRGVAEGAKELVLHLATTSGRLGIHRVDESSRLLDEVFQALDESERRQIERHRSERLSTTLSSPNGELLKAILARVASERAASGRSIAVQPPNELGQKPQFTAFVVHTEPDLTNAHIQSAKGLKGHDRPTVEITLTPAGRDINSALTRESVGKRLAIVIDDTVISAPIVPEPIAKGTLRVLFGQGGTPEDDADLMASLWAFLIGLEPLPAELTLLAERSSHGDPTR